MDAGRELDALVAEKVMGIEIPKWLEIPDGLSTMTSHEIIPAYSTDIADAWQIIEHLKTRGVWLYSLEQRWEISSRVIFEWRTPDGLRYAQEMGDTAPHAICLAALKAVGVEL